MISFAVIILITQVATGCVDRQRLLGPREDGAPDGGTVGSPAVAIASGDAVTCAIAGGSLWCTGSGARYGLGSGALEDRSALAPSGVATDWADVALGAASGCALRTAGGVECCGRNDHGQAGVGSRDDVPTPASVTLDGRAVAVDARFGSACAILENGELRCWGYNGEGGLGLGDPLDSCSPRCNPDSDRLEPVAFAPGQRFVRVSVGEGHICAIDIDGALWCAGRNSGEELGLGDGALDQIRSPARVAPAWSDWIEIAAGQNYTCGIRRGGTLWCWGLDDEIDPSMPGSSAGPLGIEGHDIQASPAQVESEGWEQVVVHTFHTCAIRNGGELWCWGRNAEGQLGLGDRVARDRPAIVSEIPDCVETSVGAFHTCARRRDGSIWCTGQNASGQLGLGDLDPRTRFTRSTLGP
jgi:alpha-tubulin suppressor-like RCC1 family protein